MNEDAVYIEQFIAGEQQGFEMLVRKYQDRALNIVYSLIGNDRETEDITQESFLKVYHNLGSFKQNSQFSTWFYRIIVNTAYDFLRRRKNFVNDEIAIEKSVSTGERPGDALLIKERDAMVRIALAGIPIKYRTALVLKDVEGLSYIEISRILRCSLGTVESKIFRARQFLRGKLLNSGEGLL
ncbi:MAG: sigma-70 family RNA polymerase sigma factor [Candidatus Omnitrophica bacterium]|jgi:RNA polymerase sigma-70 factor (ECF subfamily)|nr:sigma-70 family RNA polymerase sigma factor [Candidatus Omnitrophota bacterium]MDD5079689.1 sigma-70 family RNA polymerase sigma factor [Candidatus Omnitrophota bacterium]